MKKENKKQSAKIEKVKNEDVPEYVKIERQLNARSQVINMIVSEGGMEKFVAQTNYLKGRYDLLKELESKKEKEENKDGR